MCTDKQDETGWILPTGRGAGLAHACGGRSLPQAPVKNATIIPIIARRGACAGSCNADGKDAGDPNPTE